LCSASSDTRAVRRSSRRLGLCLSFLAHERIALRISTLDMVFLSEGILRILELVFQEVVRLFSKKKRPPVRVASTSDFDFSAYGLSVSQPCDIGTLACAACFRTWIVGRWLRGRVEKLSPAGMILRS